MIIKNLSKPLNYCLFTQFSSVTLYMSWLLYLTGKFQLFPESTEIIDAREMIYDMVLTSKEGKIYYFYGKKIIKDDEFFETGLEDTTTLFTKIYEGSNSNGLLLAKGVLKIKFFDFMKQLNTVEIINTDSTMEKLKWQAKFGNFFMKELWDTYSFLSPSYKFDPDAPPRKKRELNIKIMPKNYRCVTEDKVRSLFEPFQLQC